MLSFSLSTDQTINRNNGNCGRNSTTKRKQTFRTKSNKRRRHSCSVKNSVLNVFFFLSLSLSLSFVFLFFQRQVHTAVVGPISIIGDYLGCTEISGTIARMGRSVAVSGQPKSTQRLAIPFRQLHVFFMLLFFRQLDVLFEPEVFIINFIVCRRFYFNFLFGFTLLFCSNSYFIVFETSIKGSNILGSCMFSLCYF